MSSAAFTIRQIESHAQPCYDITSYDCDIGNYACTGDNCSASQECFEGSLSTGNSVDQQINGDEYDNYYDEAAAEPPVICGYYSICDCVYNYEEDEYYCENERFPVRPPFTLQKEYGSGECPEP